MRHGLLAVLSVVMVVLVGCSGPGQTVPIAPNMTTVQEPSKVRSAPRVAVVPFEDVRTDKTAIGRHQHYVESNVDRFVPVEGSASDQVTKFVVDYLKQAEIPVTLSPAGQASSNNADVIMTGQIESYWNEAVRRFSKTELSSKNSLRIKLTNLSDGSTTSATVGGEATTKVMNFSLADLERLSGEALGQSLSRFLSDVMVSDRSFKPKRAD